MLNYINLIKNNHLNITIHKNAVERYKELSLPIEYMGSVFIILVSLYKEQYDLLDIYDSGNTDKNVLLIYQCLHRRGFLEKDEQDDEETIYRITELGVEFTLQLLDESERELIPPKELEEKIVKVEVEDVNSWIGDWISIFPKGNVHGRYLRNTETECADRMRWFMKNYEYGKDVIMSATRAYIKFQANSQSGHAYTRSSSYFIFKGRSKNDRTSDLANWCERYINGELEHVEEDPYSKLI